MSKVIRASVVMTMMVLTASPAALAQAVSSYEAPTLSWGVPDLEGFWDTSSVTQLTRPPSVDRLVLTPEEAKRLEDTNYHNVRAVEDSKPIDPSVGAPKKGAVLPAVGNYSTAYIDAGAKVGVVKGELRSSWIIDPPNGQIPFRVKRAASGAFTDDLSGAEKDYLGPESRGVSERCLIGLGGAGGPVMVNVLYDSHYQIVQSPTAVVINVEMAHDARIIPIVKSAADAASRFGPAVIHKWLGDSVGWYEGKTLVVETRNVHPLQPGPVPLSDTGKLTERFTRVGQDEILYEFAVDDPATYTQAWKGEMPVRRMNEPLYEYACHEGNYGLLNILQGARIQGSLGIALEKTGTSE